MSVLSSSTTAVHTFGRLTSNCAIRAAGKRCHAQDDSNCHYPWPSLDRLHSLADLRPIGASTRYGDSRRAHGDAARILRRGTRVAHGIKSSLPTFGGPESGSVRSRKVWPVPWGSPIHNGGSRSAARNGRDNREHDWDHLADFWKFGIWPCSVRSNGAIRVASAATLPSYVSAIAVALATGRHRPSGEYSELAWGTASQDSANASTKPVTAGGNEQERRVGGCYREGRCGLRYSPCQMSI